MKSLKLFFIILSVIILSACSTNSEPEIIGISPNKDLKASFAFEDRIYSIQRGLVLEKNIENEIGKITEIVKEIKKNGEAKIYNSSINLKSGTKIYKIEETDKGEFIAIKIYGKYYGAFYNSKLNE